MSLVQTLRYITAHPLNAHNPLAALAGFARWQIKSRLVPGDHVHDWIGGAKFIACRGLTGLTANIYAGLQEFEDMAFLLHYLRPDDFFVDVGANVGAYTVLAGAVVGARGIALEPVPSTFSRLSGNVRINGREHRVQCLNMGAGDRDAVLRFSADEDTMNHVLSEREAGRPGVDVPVRRLDTLLGEKRPAFLKVDVEGFETAVIEGAGRAIAGDHPMVIVMELNGCGQRYGYSEDALMDRMRGLGFQPCSYDPLARKLAVASGRHTEGNTILVRGLEFAKERVASAPTFTIQGRSL
jgi:FkbM family methyltransferase